MKAEMIHVTDHAVLRWSQRVSNGAYFTIHDIIHDLRMAQVITRDEILPFNTIRQPNTVYAFYRGVLFVCESIDINIYRLITVITYSENHIVKIKKTVKRTDRKEIESEPEPEPEQKRRKPKARVKRICLDEYDL